MRSTPLISDSPPASESKSSWGNCSSSRPCDMRWAQDVRLFRSDIRTKPDQLEFLVGFRAPARSNTRPFGAHLSLGFVAGATLTAEFGSVTTSRFPPALANISYSAQLANATFISSAGPRSFTGGPLVALELPKRLSVEMQAINRPLRSSVQIFLPGGSKALRVADHRSTWEFPVLAQYRHRIGRARPFVENRPLISFAAGCVRRKGLWPGRRSRCRDTPRAPEDRAGPTIHSLGTAQPSGLDRSAA